jgi:DNA-binding MarR family transcriptional regulator
VADDSMRDLGSELSLYAARLIRQLRRELPQPVGMRVLSILDETGPIGITSLAAIDQCSQSTMSGAVTTLVERGWVAKRPDPVDARGSLVTLTPAGRRTLASARRANGAAIADRLAATGVGADHLATAVFVLRTVLEKEAE